MRLDGGSPLWMLQKTLVAASTGGYVWISTKRDVLCNLCACFVPPRLLKWLEIWTMVPWACSPYDQGLFSLVEALLHSLDRREELPGLCRRRNTKHLSFF